MKYMHILLVLMLALQTALKSKHFLTFIMPCYNCSKTVQESLDSIYKQNITSCDFEVICTDDDSSDNTHTILENYATSHHNMRVYKHTVNRGAGAASNTCISHAQGDLLFRLDSDNMLAHPNDTDRLVELLDAVGCDGATVQELRFFVGDKKAQSSWFYQAPQGICDLQHCITTIQDPAHSGNYLFTKSSWLRAGGYPEDHGSDTFRFGFAQYATGTCIAILPNSFYWHFYNTHGYWGREEVKGTNKIKGLETLLRYSYVFNPATRKKLKSCTNIFDLITTGQLQLSRDVQ